MRVIKYSTEHLVAIEANDQKGVRHYQIFEKEDYNNKKSPKPIALYSKYSFLLADEFPQDAKSYKYFDEMVEVLSVLRPIINSQNDILEK